MSPVKKRSKKQAVEPVAELMTKRNELAELLTIAAQIEHDVMVQYLFASASLKKNVLEQGCACVGRQRRQVPSPMPPPPPLSSPSSSCA